jgi:adenylate cyclase
MRAWLLPGTPAEGGGRLPLRVQRDLEREQFHSELLVTAVQLLLVAVLAALYASTPAGWAPGAPVEAAPLGLVLLALLALVRLYTAWTGQLTRPVLAAGVVAEMVVLLGVIWAYHLQYEQPVQFSLKSTQFVYVFVLISLRALRFEPVWVLLSGLTAAVGWSSLVALSIRQASGNPITWDYVTSLRSIQIHLGGELDKVLAIVVVTGVLALALTRARHLLELPASGGTPHPPAWRQHRQVHGRRHPRELRRGRARPRVCRPRAARSRRHPAGRRRLAGAAHCRRPVCFRCRRRARDRAGRVRHHR